MLEVKPQGERVCLFFSSCVRPSFFSLRSLAMLLSLSCVRRQALITLISLSDECEESCLNLKMHICFFLAA